MLRLRSEVSFLVGFFVLCHLLAVLVHIDENGFSGVGI